MECSRRHMVMGLLGLPFLRDLNLETITQTVRLIQTARSQIGVTLMYDPAYVRLDYPGGDVPRDRGVCIDVVIRAYRDAFNFDFQQQIHQDMRANFEQYPRNWGLSQTDRNIDHRRVPNLETWLQRHGHERPATDWQAGDLVTCKIGGRLPHIGILTNRITHSGNRLGVHNIGAGTQEDDGLWGHSHYRRFSFLP